MSPAAQDSCAAGTNVLPDCLGRGWLGFSSGSRFNIVLISKWFPVSGATHVSQSECDLLQQ